MEEIFSDRKEKCNNWKPYYMAPLYFKQLCLQFYCIIKLYFIYVPQLKINHVMTFNMND